MDHLTKRQRSRLMSRIRSVSRLERRARSAAEAAAGCPLRSGRSGLPGRPDYFNKARKTVVFVHGCYWHLCPLHGRIPKTNRKFWAAKLAGNARRDAANLEAYRRAGWTAVVLWEHSLG